MDEAAGLVLPVKRRASLVHLKRADRSSLTTTPSFASRSCSEAEPGQAFGSAHFDRLARRVLALEEAIRVD
jgi:hypothetical protein